MISTAQLQALEQRIATATLNDELIAQLRQEFAPLHFTYCADDDVASIAPVSENDGFNLYLIDGREHCLALTNDLTIATGVVVAEVYPDD